jgi:hypothetical protein
MNNIEWKKSSIDYDKLNQLSHQQLTRIENGKQTISKNSSYIARSKGGETNKKTGHISNLGKKYGSQIGKKYGKENIKHTKTPEAIAKQVASVSKAIQQLSIDGKLIKEWDSMNDAKRAGYHAGHISNCCNGLKPQYKGYLWIFKNIG